MLYLLQKNMLRIIGFTVIVFGLVSFSLLNQDNSSKKNTKLQTSVRIDTFSFSSNGKTMKAKIYLPADFESNKNLPAIFLIDFTEQHFKLATDEFEKVINGVQQIEGFDALVVSLADIPDIDAEPETFGADYGIYKNMTAAVLGTYTNNSSHTFIGKGSESGVVIMALLLENSESPLFDNFIATDPSGLYASAIIKMIEDNDFPQNKTNKKLHFSFSTSNDRVKCNQIIELIKKAKYPWLQFKGVEYTQSNYENTYPVSFAEGLKFIFDE